MITDSLAQTSARRPAPRPRPPAPRTVRPATAWDNVDRVLLEQLAGAALRLDTITKATGYSPGLVKDQLTAFIGHGLVAKDAQTGRYELTSAGKNRLAALTAPRPVDAS